MGGDFIVSNNLNLLKSGLYPEALCTITIADMGQDFVDFANNNIDLFYQPNKGPYGAANALLNKYINDQIESSNIGNRPILDHSKFISELIKTIKGPDTNVTIENERAPFSIQPYVQETKDE